MVASAIRSSLEQPDGHAASEQLRRVADDLAGEQEWRVMRSRDST
jgi:hypothetical protein